MTGDDKCSYGLVIGRFQPFHNAHQKLIREALKRHKNVLVLIGSYRQARDTRNPFTYAERVKMILDSFTEKELWRMECAPVRDFFYNDSLWISEVQRVVDGSIGSDKPIQLVGHSRDASSQYLTMFPQWGFEEVGKLDGDISGTDIRRAFFSTSGGSADDLEALFKKYLPSNVVRFMKNFRGTPEYLSLVNEFEFIQKYKAAWKAAPYAPTLVTTDCLVIKSGHVLVVKRKAMPGKGLLALPGGFLQQDETIEDGAIRELKEETGIAIPKDQLRKAIIDKRVFDHPLRSLRARTITHVFCINLGSGPLPRVKGMDDAEKANWIPLHEVFANDDKFFEDHWYIINCLTSKF